MIFLVSLVKVDCHAADGFGGNVTMGHQPHRLLHYSSSDSGSFK
jgi:hypothetical protein